jgi:hypothetical protein
MIQDIRMIFSRAWMTFSARIDDGVPGFIGDPEEASGPVAQVQGYAVRGAGINRGQTQGYGSAAFITESGKRPMGTREELMSAKLWSLGVFLVALGVAAHVVGWEALLWLPRIAMDSLLWAPAALVDVIRSAPATFGVIVLGVVLMVVARLMRRRKDRGG